MKSAFDPERMEWKIGWPGRVARHDLVYGSPPEDPTQGIPLGNGDVGVLAWCEGSRIVMAVNKCDLLDDPVPLSRLKNWSPDQEELSPTQRHAGRITIDFGLPVFDPFYLAEFEARLSLADAAMILHASGPLGTADLRAFVDHESGTLCVSVLSELSEEAPVRVSVERYGSRTFGHWYSLVKRDPSAGLAGTEAFAEDRMAAVTQELSTGTFALGCLAETRGADSAAAERLHSRASSIRFPAGSSTAFELYAAVSSPMDTPPADRISAIRTVLEASAARGFESVYAGHAARWKEFWTRSLVESGDDYLDNLWHLTMYYANASQRGRYPGRFIFGQWGWNRDVQHWTFYFHWNQQQVYWPLNAAGHHDLLTSYLEYRFGGLPYAREDARRRMNAPGAVVSDVADWHGRNSEGELDNHTPVAQIALDFWRQYRFTGDRRFLAERALPYMLEAAAFFETLFEKMEDGLYHAREGTGYEGWIRMRDAITELTCGRALFSAVLEALQEAGTQDPRTSRWREILDSLAPLPSVRPEGCFAVTGGMSALGRGAFKGRRSFGDRTLAAGWGIREERILTSKVPADPTEGEQPDPYTVLHRLEANETLYTAIREDMKVFDGIFPFVEYSAVFPTNVVGLGQRGTEVFDLAANTALLYAPDCMGWDPLPIVLARLGLAEELAEILKAFPSRWQYHCNGFGHYGPRDIQKSEAALRFRTNLVRDADSPKNDDERFPFQMWPFRHMGMESMSVLSCAVNESLLQSHDGVIRVGPAAPVSREKTRFTLHAACGFVVSAELERGRPLWIAVESLRGGEFRVESPWDQAHVVRNGAGEGARNDRIIDIAMKRGDLLLLTPEKVTMDGWETVQEDPAANPESKRCPLGWTRLGLPRMF